MSEIFEEIGLIKFPAAIGLNINMMPIIFGDLESIPYFCSQYLEIMNKVSFEKGKLAYLTITESWVEAGKTQRRSGVHTDATNKAGWGGGSWGCSDGIYMASNDGLCRAWDCVTDTVDNQGSVQLVMDVPEIEIQFKPNYLYWMTDRVPHESLPAKDAHYRQFFRLVSDQVSVWWAQHSTQNPLGVQPNCKIEYGNKFIL